MLSLDQIIIDPEFRDELPVYDDDGLADEIATDGWTDEPITVWLHHNILVDGHRRLAIWKAQGGDGPQVREKHFASRDEALLWANKHQGNRRNETDEQRKYRIGRQYTLQKKVKGGYENVAAGKDESNHQNDGSISDGENNVTAKRMAAELGIGQSTVERAERFSNAVNDLDKAGIVPKADILSGKVKVPASKVVEAGNAAKSGDVEKAKAVLTEAKPAKTKKEDAPTQETANEQVTIPANGKRPVGVEIANEAINCLIRIPKNDPLRKRGFQIVTDWIKANQ